MTAIGLCMLVFAFLANAALEVIGNKNHWYEIALAYIGGFGFVLMSCGFVLWIWRTFP